MRVAISALSVVALLGAVACGSDEPGDGGGGDSDPLTFPTQTRTAALNFASGDEKYLVTVWSTPGISEASPSSDVTYDLGAEAGTSGVRFSRVQSAKKPATETSAYWQSRIAFEGDRRNKIEAWSHSAQAGSGAPFVKSEAVRDATCAADGCTQQYKFDGATRTFNYVGTISEDVKVTVLTDSATAASSALLAVASDFAKAAKTDLSVMGPSGHTGALDADGGGTITVVFTDNFGSLSSDIIGAFIFEDFLASGSSSNGNHADILWARTPTTSDTVTPAALIVGTLAHEYQHLVSFALRSSLGDPVASREVLWLDEGISHLMEDLTGWGGSNVDAIAQAVDKWDSAPFAGPDDTVAQRGKAYTMLRYLVDARAKTLGATNAKDSKVITAAHDLIAPLYTQTRAGFTHALFQTNRSNGGLRDWLRAVFVTGNTDVTASVDTKFLATATSPESNGQLIGFDPFGTYTTAKNQQVTVGGVDSDDADASDAISDSIASSGAHYYIVSGGTGTVNLKLTADSASDISVDAVRVE